MWTYLIAIFLIMALLTGWIGVQHLYRKFSEQHPEWGPPPEEGGGCGFFCFCKNKGSCARSNLKDLAVDKANKH